MSQKANLVDLIVVRSQGTAEQLQHLRQQLSAKTTTELEKIADEQTLTAYRAQAQRLVAVERQPQVIEAEQQAREKFEELQFSRICGTPVNGRVAVDNQANRNVIRSWINFDEQISPEWFTKILAENSNLAKTLTWQTARLLDPKYREQVAEAQDQQDRAVFTAFARENGFADIDANFYLAKDLFFAGHSFNQYELLDAVQSGKLHLAPASPEQIAEYQQEAAELRRDFLVNRASPEELRQAVRQEAEERRQALQRAEQERQIAGREKADAAYGFPPLPEVNLETGERIDAAYLNRLSNVDLTRFKMMMRKYGAAALTRRLNDRG